MKTVLLADDRDVSRELTRTLLEHCGYFVIEAASGEEAIRLAEARCPDLILLDIQMPGKDGYSVLAELRSQAGLAATPIVALTASAMLSEETRAKSAGFSRFLTKPISLTTLKRELASLLSSVPTP